LTERILVDITPFSSSHYIDEDELNREIELQRKDRDNKGESEEYLRSIAIREILTPIVENDIEFDFEEVKNWI